MHLLPPYLTFASLDRKSVRFTIPLCTIRRVERLNARTGVFALSLIVWHGMKIVCFLSPQLTGVKLTRVYAQIVQLTALRPTADAFCALLRDALKEQLQQGQMKAMKVFVKTCFSEDLLSSGAEGEKASFVIEEGTGEPVPNESTFHCGLGIKYKFPGDPKKSVSNCHSLIG